MGLFLFCSHVATVPRCCLLCKFVNSSTNKSLRSFYYIVEELRNDRGPECWHQAVQKLRRLQMSGRMTPRDRFVVKSLRKCDTFFLERMSLLVDPGLKLRWALTRWAWVPCSTVIFFPLLGKRAWFFPSSVLFWHFQKKCPLLS